MTRSPTANRGGPFWWRCTSSMRSVEARHPGRHPHRSAKDVAREPFAQPGRPLVAACRRLLSGEMRVELSWREHALFDRHCLEGVQPPRVVADDVLRSGKTLRRPPESLLGIAEHRNAHERGREHAPLPWVMEDRLVGLDRDRTEPLLHSTHVEDCCVHRLLSFQLVPEVRSHLHDDRLAVYSFAASAFFRAFSNRANSGRG